MTVDAYTRLSAVSLVVIQLLVSWLHPSVSLKSLVSILTKVSEMSGTINKEKKDNTLLNMCYNCSSVRQKNPFKTSLFLLNLLIQLMNELYIYNT